MAQNVTGGWGSYANYGYETTYGTATTGPREFGYGTTVSIGRKNNLEQVYGLGARNAVIGVAKKFEGTASVEFDMSNGSFFRSVLGTVTDGGAAPFTHTYTEANTLPSFILLTGSELGTTDEVVALLGCVVKTCNISAAVDELAKVKLELAYANETLATTGIGSQTAPHADSFPFTFANGTLSVGGSTVAYCQSVELNIDNGTELIWGLGSRLATTPVAKKRAYGFKMNVVYSDPSLFLQKVYGATTGPLAASTPASMALVLTFTNGGAGGAQRSIVLTFANLYLDTEDIKKDVAEVLKEDLAGFALSCTNVVWSNNTASDDDTP